MDFPLTVIGKRWYSLSSYTIYKKSCQHMTEVGNVVMFDTYILFVLDKFRDTHCSELLHLWRLQMRVLSRMVV